MSHVWSQTVEFHRHGDSDGILGGASGYIRTEGWDAPARETSSRLTHRDFLRHLNALRYSRKASDADVRAARECLAGEAVRFLDAVRSPREGLLQVDVVTNAGELWAFPFEACFAEHTEWLARADHGVEITRRVRGGFSAQATTWPVTPRVLFLHAPRTDDLEQDLIDDHVRALQDALRPWAGAKDLADTSLLRVHEVFSAADVTRYRADTRPTYVHVLAHGAVAPGDPLLPEEQVWGLRLGYEGEPGVAPAELAAALTPEHDAPLVVTLAACDGANQAGSAFAVRSVVQELHRCGVPVVVGSQLPLTKPGSTTLTRVFYAHLLEGEDVRLALHAARAALHADQASEHDWLSLVGYVRLPPEGYAEHLDEVGVRRDLRRLEAIQSHADRLATPDVPLERFTEVECALQERLAVLEARRARLAHRHDLLDECAGLEASAWKRLAEVRHLRSLRFEAYRERDQAGSLDALQRARDGYRTGYYASLRSHWLGMQQVSLELVLTGRVARPEDCTLVARAAELAIDAAARQGRNDPWPFGTLVELALIAPSARLRKRGIGAARKLVDAARSAKDDFPIVSTQRQLNRYVQWWTTAHGYFPGRTDLSGDAGELLTYLV